MLNKSEKSTLQVLIPILLIALTIEQAIAQPNPYVVAEGPLIHQSSKRRIVKKLLFQDNTGYFFLTGKGKKGEGKKGIQKFDDRFLPQGKPLELNFHTGKSYPNTLDVISLGSNAFHIYSLSTKNGLEFYSQKTDLATGSFEEAKKIADLTKQEVIIDFVEIKILEDKMNNSFLLFHTVPDGATNEKKARIYRLNSNGDLLGVEKYSFPHQSALFDFMKIIPVGNKGSILIGRFYETTNHPKCLRQKKYGYFIYLLKQGEITELKRIDLNGIHLQSLESGVDDKKNLIINGLWADQHLNTPKGLYYLRINLENTDEITESRTELPKDFYANPDNQNAKMSATKASLGFSTSNEDSFYLPKKTIMVPNGETLFVVEQQYKKEASLSNTGTQTPPLFSDPVYYHLNLAVIKIGTDGKIVWTTRVGKNQERPRTASYSSAYCHFSGNNLYLLYNGNYRNLNVLDGGFAPAFLHLEERALLCAIIDFQGNLRKQIVHQYTQPEAVIMRPDIQLESSSNQLLLYGQFTDNLKRQGFMKVRFEK